MEDIIFYDSNRVPVMSWHEIKRENKNIFLFSRLISCQLVTGTVLEL